MGLVVCLKIWAFFSYLSLYEVVTIRAENVIFSSWGFTKPYMYIFFFFLDFEYESKTFLLP